MPHTQGIQGISGNYDLFFKLRETQGNFDFFFKNLGSFKILKVWGKFFLDLEWDLNNKVQYFVEEV